jgi:peroxiredoxin
MKTREKLMRTLCLMCMLTSVFTQAFSQNKNNFTIHGTVSSLSPVPTKIYLIYQEYLHQPTDSTTVVNGTYQFAGYTADVTGADLSLTLTSDVKNPHNRATIILDKGDLNVVHQQTLDQVEVTGSASAAFTAYHNVQNKNKAELNELAKAMGTDQFKNDPEFKKTTQTRFYSLISSSINDFLQYVRKNPESPVSPYITYAIKDLLTPQMMDTLIAGLPKQASVTPLRKALTEFPVKRKQLAEAAEIKAAERRKEIDAKLPIGSKSLNFTANDTKGNPVTLASFKGKYVLVDFWASWCMPCRAENPNVVKAYQTYKDKGFEILGISLDVETQKNAWLEAIKKDHLTWTQVVDLKRDISKLYNVESIPQNFLIDPNGVVVAKNLRGDELNAKLAAIFNK